MCRLRPAGDLSGPAGAYYGIDEATGDSKQAHLGDRCGPFETHGGNHHGKLLLVRYVDPLSPRWQPVLHDTMTDNGNAKPKARESK